MTQLHAKHGSIGHTAVPPNPGGGASGYPAAASQHGKPSLLSKRKGKGRKRKR